MPNPEDQRAAISTRPDGPGGILSDLERELGDSRSIAFLRDIRFERDTGRLSFTRIDGGHEQTPAFLILHPDDRPQFTALAGRNHVSAQLHTGCDTGGTLVLMLHICGGGLSWHTGQIAAVRHRPVSLPTNALAMLSHELRQPLFTIAVAQENLRLMLDRPNTPPAPIQRALGQIGEQVQRAQVLITRALDHAKGQAAGPEQAGMEQALRSAAAMLAPLFAEHDIRFIRQPAAAASPVNLGPVEIEQIFVNVLRNAAESIAARREQGWQGEGRIEAAFALDPQEVRCVVTDNGAGPAPQLAEQPPLPFFTTKGDAGTGLGLCICHDLAHRAGGTVRLLPGEEDGARCEITLPLCGSAPASDDAAC